MTTTEQPTWFTVVHRPTLRLLSLTSSLQFGLARAALAVFTEKPLKKETVKTLNLAVIFAHIVKLELLSTPKLHLCPHLS